FIPDEKAIPIIEEYLAKPEYKNGYILDGFPRTSKQAEDFTNGVERVIYLKVTDKEALWRLSGRFEDGIREDNTLQAIRKRIQLFHDITEPVLEYYRKQNRLLEVDGEKTIEDVTAHILTGLGVS
ncbi:MAG: nucleoside monophosphate kinase, partial [Patescibacteria group bacterium]